MKRYAVFFFLVFNLSACSQFETALVQLDAEQTGIHFINQIQEDEVYNVLDYMNIYTGAGVASGDINNDGLSDLYFGGNMVSSGLFLNQGNLIFKDITATAGVTDSRWATGVSMVDINQDGWLDIYVCVSGPHRDKRRANMLYINQKDNTFKELATLYGIDDTRQTMHATFFDYDRDNDLDLFMIVNPTDSVLNVDVIQPRKLNGQSPSTDILYRNEGIGPEGHPVFKDVSHEAGVRIEGHSLGVAISDLNEDYWPDIYISNDFIGNDILYINNQDGTFSDRAAEYLEHTSYAGMGNDVADFNNDGLPDILVLDMRPEDSYRQKMLLPASRYDRFQLAVSKGYAPQFTRNTLQLNRGNGHFSEIGFLSGISSTDWSWSGLMADYDNDGDRDLYVSNGFLRDLGNLDYINYQQVYNNGIGDLAAKKKKKLEDIKALKSVPLLDYLFENEGNLKFSKKSESWGITEKSFSSSAVYTDLDNDGDLELVVSTLNDKVHIYENRSRQLNEHHFLKIKLTGSETNTMGIGTKIRLYTGDSLQFYEHYLSRGYESSVDPVVHFGLGHRKQVDSLEVIWPDENRQMLVNIKADQTMLLKYEESSSFIKEPNENRTSLFSSFKIKDAEKHKENEQVDFKVQPLLPHMHSRLGPGIAVGDVNNDGLEDFFVGGAANQCVQLQLQQPDGTFAQGTWKYDCNLEDTGLLLFDADNDQDLDLYVVSGGTAFPEEDIQYQDRLYLNDGNANFKKAETALPHIGASGSDVSAADFDKDGDLDLFVGGRVIPGRYPLAPKSYLLRNDSFDKKCQFTDITDEMNGLSKIGMVSAVLWTDYDLDGWKDLLLAGEFMPLTLYHNELGNLVNRTSECGLGKTNGWWNSLAPADFDQDGDIDYLAGNLGLNSRYQASKAEPLCIYASDYDKNGSLDPVICYYIEGENHLAHSREDIVKQINAMRARFQNYQDYAETSFIEAFLPQELDEAFVSTAYQFSSSYIENLGEGQFILHSLPIEAQIAPIYGMQTNDYNRDGFTDALLIGNSYATDVTTGQYDASKGTLLLGDGRGGFKTSSTVFTGFIADQDARSLVKLKTANNFIDLLSNNDGPLQAYHFNGEGQVYEPSSQDAYATVTTKQGKSYVHEFYHGNGYLSQSSRSLSFPPNVSEVEIYLKNGISKKLNTNDSLIVDSNMKIHHDL